MCRFLCNNLMLAIELDGHTHSFEEVAYRDRIKEEKLNEIGIRVLRFKDEDVMNNIVWKRHTPLISPLFRGDIRGAISKKYLST